MLRASILLASALLVPLSAIAQTPKAATSPVTPAPSFDVVSIHLSPPSPDGHNHIWNDPHESHLRTGNLSIRDLIQYAYNLPKSQILGGPQWLNSAMYDIDAKSDPEQDAKLKALSGYDATQQKRLMVQGLLVDRFALAAHHETRELPIYNLLLAKSGAKFQPSTRDGTTIDTGRSRVHIAGSDDTIGLLARELAQSQGRVVVNKTGLTGRYDLTLAGRPMMRPLSSSTAHPIPTPRPASLRLFKSS